MSVLIQVRNAPNLHGKVVTNMHVAKLLVERIVAVPLGSSFREGTQFDVLV